MFVSFSFPAPRCKGNISPLSLPKSVGAHKQCSAAAPHRHYNLSVLGANLFSITAPRIYIRLISCLLQKPKVHKYRPMSLSKELHAAVHVLLLLCLKTLKQPRICFFSFYAPASGSEAHIYHHCIYQKADNVSGCSAAALYQTTLPRSNVSVY